MEMVSSHIFILKLASNEARTFLHVDLLLRMLQASAHQHMMIYFADFASHGQFLSSRMLQMLRLQ